MLDFPDLRRRQPLLRGARRVHPPPRPAMRKRGDAVGDDRRQAATPRRRTGEPLHPEPDVRPGVEAGRAQPTTSAAKAGVGDMRAAFGELDPMDERPEYRNRDARLELMDEQGLEACIMLPTLGVGMETALEHDPDALLAVVPRVQPVARRGLGLQLPGPHLRGAVHHAASTSTGRSRSSSTRSRTTRGVDPDAAGLGVRRRASPLAGRPRARRVLGPTERGRRHARRSTVATPSYARVRAAVGPHRRDRGVPHPPLKRLLSASPIHDTMASLLADKLFERFPNLRVATIETGSGWVKPLLKSSEGRDPGAGRVRPGPVRAVPRARLGVAVLRGRRAGARSTSSAPIVWSSAPTTRTPRGSPTRRASSRRSTASADVDVKKIMHDNARFLVTPARRLDLRGVDQRHSAISSSTVVRRASSASVCSSTSSVYSVGWPITPSRGITTR